MTRYLSFGFIVGALGSVLLVIGNVVQMTVPGDKFSQQVMTTSWVIASALRLIGAALMLVGLGTLIAGQAHKSGWFALVTYVLVIVNMVFQTGWMFSDTFIVRAFAQYAPNVIDAKNSPPSLSLGFMLAWFLNATFILFAFALWRAKYYRLLVPIGVFVAGIITVIPLPVDGPIYEVIIGAAMALAFVAALKPRNEHSAPEPSVRTDAVETVDAR